MPSYPTYHLTGQTIGACLILEEIPTARRSGICRRWRCQCRCGTIFDCRQDTILQHPHFACRKCNSVDAIAKCSTQKGLAKTREYTVWREMLRRCRNPHSKSYHLYGGRGIIVVPRWDSFENFLADMGLRPHPRLTLERLDNDGPYSPENCVWASWKVQRRNSRQNRLITLNGETKCMVEWAELSGLSPQLVKQRISIYGWSPERALSQPPQRRGR